MGFGAVGIANNADDGGAMRAGIGIFTAFGAGLGADSAAGMYN